jgi:hypothetical protein
MPFFMFKKLIFAYERLALVVAFQLGHFLLDSLAQFFNKLFN